MYLLGVMIGAHSAIGDRNVITHSVLPFCIVVENPAGVIQKCNYEKYVRKM